jgi:Ni/Fe-hydrogenase 1 B-type cytochrome subunit
MSAVPEILPTARPLPTDMVIPLPDHRRRLYVWQVPVRATHWVTAGCIVVLSLTGGYIADPFLIPPGGSVMGNVRLIHMVAAFTLLVSGVVRTLWLIVGNRFARWSAFFPTSRRQAAELFRQAAFYAFLTNHHPKVLGHNQLAAAAYVALWALLLVETVTGFALDGLVGAEPGATGFWWIRELVGPQALRVIHHLVMWLILAIALFHVYSCLLIDHIERNGLVSSIVSGYKYVTPEEIAEARDGGLDVSGLDVGGLDGSATDAAATGAGELVTGTTAAGDLEASSIITTAAGPAATDAGQPDGLEIGAGEPRASPADAVEVAR